MIALPPALLGEGPAIVAFSGGGDSMALLHLAARALPGQIHAVTVNHGLRDVRAELAFARAACARLSVPHAVLEWSWDGQGNLQSAARQGRMALIGAFARKAGIEDVLLGHTADDQAETVLMRLARGSGVDGLAGMAPLRRADGLNWRRPMLHLERAALRDWLRGEGIDWAEDPSNDDPRFDRVSTRQMMAALEGLGLTRGRLLQLADHAGAARAVLDRVAGEYASGCEIRAGALILPRDVLDLDNDTQRRVLAAALRWIGRSPYRPRWEALCRFAAQAQEQPVATLGGVLAFAGERLILAREPAAAPPPAPFGTLWDGWRITGPAGAGLHIGPLGAALPEVPDWREIGLPRQALLASPALWDGAALVAAPALGHGPWRAERATDFTGMFVKR